MSASFSSDIFFTFQPPPWPDTSFPLAFLLIVYIYFFLCYVPLFWSISFLSASICQIYYLPFSLLLTGGFLSSLPPSSLYINTFLSVLPSSLVIDFFPLHLF
jgi:hypothetical protein